MQENGPKSTHNRNRIEIQKICPAISKSELCLTNENTILGVSIKHPASTGNKASAIFNFLYKNNITKINLFIGDSLYRYTAMIKYGCSEEEARKIGEQEGIALKNSYLEYIQEYNAPYQFNFFYTSELEQNKDFIPTCKELWKLYEVNTTFRDSVLNFSQVYLSRMSQDNKNGSAENVEIVQNACKYLIEELAMLSILNQRGLNQFLYPGTIQTIYDIITIDLPYVSDLFKNYLFVSLRINRSKKK